MLASALTLFLAWPANQEGLRPRVQECLEILQEHLPSQAPEPDAGNAPLEGLLAALLEHAARADDQAAARQAGFLALGYLLDQHDQLRQAPGWDALFQDLIPPALQARLRSQGSLLELHGRQDLAAHFFVGAALECLLGERNAARVGLTKETWDAGQLERGKGTGFSFQDLCAHDAGVQFSKHLRQHWPALRGGDPLTLVDWMPFVDDLEEGLGTRQLRDRYGSTRGAGFRMKRESLQARILGCAGYRALRREAGAPPGGPPAP